MCPFNEFIRTNLQQNKIIHFLFLNLNDWAENFINELCTGSRSLNWDRRIVAMDQTHQTNLNYPYYFYFSQSKCVFFLFASVAIIVKMCNETKTKRECGRFCFQLISLDDDNDRRFMHFIYSRAFYVQSAFALVLYSLQRMTMDVFDSDWFIVLWSLRHMVARSLGICIESFNLFPLIRCKAEQNKINWNSFQNFCKVQL